MRLGHTGPLQTAPLSAVIQSEGPGTRSGEQEIEDIKTSMTTDRKMIAG